MEKQRKLLKEMNEAIQEMNEAQKKIIKEYERLNYATDDVGKDKALVLQKISQELGQAMMKNLNVMRNINEKTGERKLCTEDELQNYAKSFLENISTCHDAITSIKKENGDDRLDKSRDGLITRTLSVLSKILFSPISLLVALARGKTIFGSEGSRITLFHTQAKVNADKVAATISDLNKNWSNRSNMRGS